MSKEAFVLLIKTTQMQLRVLPSLPPTWNRDVMPGAKATILRPGDHKHYFKDGGMEKTLPQLSH